MLLGGRNPQRIRGSARCMIVFVGRMRGCRTVPGAAEVVDRLPVRLEAIASQPSHLDPDGPEQVGSCVCKEVRRIRGDKRLAYVAGICSGVSAAGVGLLYLCQPVVPFI